MNERLTDEEIDDIQEAAYRALRARGYNGGMGGETWDRASARAIESAVLASAGVPVVQPQEPVAWRFAHNRGHGRVAYTYHDNEPSNDYRTAYRDTCVEITPLYAAPQARQEPNQGDGGTAGVQPSDGGQPK